MSGAIAELKSRHSSDGFLLETVREQDAETLAEQIDGLQLTEPGTLEFHGGGDGFFELLKFLAVNRIALQRVERMEPDLESLFLEVTK